MALVDLLLSFYRGFYDSLYSINLIRFLFCKKELLGIYKDIVVYNVNVIIIHLISNLIIKILENNNIKNVNILYYIVLFVWNIPHYLLGNIINISYTSYLLNGYIKNYSNNIKYKKETNGQFIVNYLYTQIIMLIYLLQSSIVTNIPIIGIYLDIILTSLTYSFYCWEYICNNYKIIHFSRYSLFESKWIYFLGYGFFIGLIKYYFSFFIGYHLISLVFPIIALNKIFIYKYNGNKIKNLNNEQNKVKIHFFIIPIWISNKIINLIIITIKNIN